MNWSRHRVFVKQINTRLSILDLITAAYLVGVAISYGVVESESNGAVVEQYAPDNSNGTTSVATTNGFTVTEAVSQSGPSLQVSFSSSTTNTVQYSDFRLSTHKSRTDVGDTTIDHYYKLIDLYHTTGLGGAVRPYAYNSDWRKRVEASPSSFLGWMWCASKAGVEKFVFQEGDRAPMVSEGFTPKTACAWSFPSSYMKPVYIFYLVQSLYITPKGVKALKRPNVDFKDFSSDEFGFSDIQDDLFCLYEAVGRFYIPMDYPLWGQSGIGTVNSPPNLYARYGKSGKHVSVGIGAEAAIA